MSIPLLYLLPAAFCLLALLATAQQQVEPLSENCIGCICEASSSCNITSNCAGEVCGLFKITRPYWLDANQPTLALDNPASPGAFERCVTDTPCAAAAVRNYMARFAQDCNRDGVVNCLDYAAIHRLGGYGCSAPIDPEYLNRFYSCQQSLASSGVNIDIRSGQLPPGAV